MNNYEIVLSGVKGKTDLLKDHHEKRLNSVRYNSLFAIAVLTHQ